MFDKSITNEYSTRGLSHIEHNLPNQDATLCFEQQVNGKSYTLLAVMDGVSSSIKADQASKFLKDKLKMLFIQYITDIGDDESFSLDIVKKMTNDLYEQYVLFIVQNEGSEQEFATTLEMVVLCKNKAYTLHAGDGLISLSFDNGEFSISSLEGHSGSEPGLVYPFMYKRKWEFHEYEKVIGVFVSSDGVYNELIPAMAVRNGYPYDSSLMLPMMDVRAHKNMKSMERFQKSFVVGKLNDNAICQACYILLKKGLIQGIDTNQLKKQFSICQPYKKFCHSRDDLSFVFWSDYKKLPSVYDISKTLPNYYGLWLKETKN